MSTIRTRMVREEAIGLLTGIGSLGYALGLSVDPAIAYDVVRTQPNKLYTRPARPVGSI